MMNFVFLFALFLAVRANLPDGEALHGTNRNGNGKNFDIVLKYAASQKQPNLYQKVSYRFALFCFSNDAH